jgi:hypothetical protein
VHTSPPACLPLLALLLAGAAFGQSIQYPQPPVAPTNFAQCESFSNAIDQVYAIATEAHRSCLARHFPNTETNEFICAVPACQTLHDLSQYVPVHRPIQECFDQARQYQGQLALEQQAIDQQGVEQRATLSAQAHQEISNLNAGGLAAQKQTSQLDEDAHLQEQIADAAQQLANAGSARSAPVPELSPADLARLERAQRTEQLTASIARQTNASGEGANLSEFAEVHAKLSANVHSEYIELLEEGLKAALKSSGTEGRAVVETWDLGERAAQFTKDAQSIANAGDRPGDAAGTLQAFSDAAKLTGAPLVGLDGVVSSESAILRMEDHLFAVAQPLFSTSAQSLGTSYDPAADLVKALPYFDAFKKVTETLDKLSVMNPPSISAFSQLLNQ